MLYLLLLLAEIIVDLMRVETRTCIRSNPHIIAPIIIHHVFNAFLLFGWLIPNVAVSYAHIATVLFTIFYWKWRYNRCDLTVYVNRKCGWNEDEPFYDLLAYFGVKHLPMWNEIGHYVVIVGALMMSVLRILGILGT